MADIVIRGMEMPKYTTKAEFGIDADGNPLCMVHHRDGTEPGIYDVVPLPAGHGRLIDADAFCRFVANNSRIDGIIATGIISYVNSAPTIIPAEGGAEDDGNAS